MKAATTLLATVLLACQGSGSHAFLFPTNKAVPTTPFTSLVHPPPSSRSNTGEYPSQSPTIRVYGWMHTGT